MTIEEKRRELFEAWVRREWPSAPLHYVRDALPMNDPRYGEYCDESLRRAWVGWQAALDAVVIILPSDPNEELCNRRAAIDGCRAAIESTGLGLKVKS